MLPHLSAGVLLFVVVVSAFGPRRYRSSPFFWAFGEALPDAAGLLYDITDGLPFYGVGTARQTLENTGRMGKLVSEVSAEAPGVRRCEGTADGAWEVKLQIEVIFQFERAEYNFHNRSFLNWVFVFKWKSRR